MIRTEARLLSATLLALAASAYAATLTPNDPNPGTGEDLVINTSLASLTVAEGVTISASGVATNYALHFVNPGTPITVGKVVIGGTVTSAWDAGFTNRQQNVLTEVIIQPTGRIYSGGWYGFYNEWNRGTISTLTNLGSISSVLNEGDIGTLNNFQNASGPDGRLRYDGNLPTNYNVVVRGADYGQVRFGGVAGATTFGIHGGDAANGIAPSTLRTGTYLDVVTNLDGSQIANARVAGTIFGTYDGSAWKLVDATYRGGSVYDWDLVVLNLGLDLAEPQRAMLERRERIVGEALDNDCVRFGPGGWGFSLKARRSGLNGEGEHAGILTVAKLLGERTRVGGFIDRRATEKELGGVRLDAGSPMAGLFAAYSGAPGGTGLQARLAVASERATADITRANLLGAAAEATGRAAVNSYGVAHRLGWGFDLGEGRVLTPHLGIRYTRSQRDAYQEDSDGGNVSDPFAYAGYGEHRTTASVGLTLGATTAIGVSYHLGAGYDRDVSQHRDVFVASTGALGEITYPGDASQRRGRWNASAGIGVELERGRAMTLDAVGRQTDLTDSPDFSVTLGYHVRL